MLTPARPSASGSASITAPPSGKQQYTLQTIDTTAFAKGGTLQIEVRVAADSATAGSFDLFRQGAVIPTEGRPTTSVANAYDVAAGRTARLSFHFDRGEVFKLGASGNWFSQSGSHGTVQYDVTVH